MFYGFLIPLVGRGNFTSRGFLNVFCVRAAFGGF